MNMNSSSRKIKREKSIKLTDGPLERRRNIKSIKKVKKLPKEKWSQKKTIKIDRSIKIRKYISNVNTQEKVEIPVLKNLEKNILKFNFTDINIINNNINILNNDNLQKSIIYLKERNYINDINLITNENINIIEIIHNKKYLRTS